MTSTSVRDVSTVMKAFTANAGNAKNAGATSFQDIWNQQTGKNTASDTSASENRKDVNTLEKSERGDNFRHKDVKNSERKGLSAGENDPVENGSLSEVDEQKLEEVMAVLGAGAVELMQEIADVFHMSMEELEQFMADRNMDAIDVLDVQKLSNLLLEAGGAADSLALLTDEGLCADYQMLMNRQKELLQEISMEVQIAPEQLTQIAEEASELQTGTGTPLTAVITEQEEKPVVIVETKEQPSDTTETVDTAAARADAVTENAITKTSAKQPDEGEHQEPQGEHAKEQADFSLLQNLKADNMNPEAQQVSGKTSSWSETTQNIMNQIMDYMRVQLKADTSSLEMQLHPASLGTLQVNVVSKGGVLTANFMTQNEAVKAVLESQMIQLKESFAEQGVKVEAIEVTVQTHQFESNLEQGRGRQQDGPEKKDRPRRINLNTAPDMDAQELTTEEQLAAEIMTANGSTVDYTA